MTSNMHPTPTQTEWLKDNYRLYSNRHLAEKLSIPENRLTFWLKLLGLRKRKEGQRVAMCVYQKKKKINPGPEKTIKRLKPDHTNISREQHVERILNMNL